MSAYSDQVKKKRQSQAVSKTNRRSTDSAGAAKRNPYGKAKKGETASQREARKKKYYTFQREDAQERGDQKTVDKIYGKMGKKRTRGASPGGPNVDADLVNKIALAVVPAVTAGIAPMISRAVMAAGAGGAAQLANRQNPGAGGVPAVRQPQQLPPARPVQPQGGPMRPGGMPGGGGPPMMGGPRPGLPGQVPGRPPMVQPQMRPGMQPMQPGGMPGQQPMLPRPVPGSSVRQPKGSTSSRSSASSKTRQSKNSTGTTKKKTSSLTHRTVDRDEPSKKNPGWPKSIDKLTAKKTKDKS